MTARREISRQEFLKISGRAAAGAAVGSTLLLATTSATLAQGLETALITDFGARGDGRADDTGAIRRAIDAIYDAGGGTVKVPATDAFYRTTAAIDLRSDLNHPVHIVGEGEKSFIKNMSQSGGHDFAPVFRTGRMVAGGSEYSAPGQDYYPIDPAQAGATHVRLSRSGLRVKAGDMLLIAGGMRQYHGNDTANWFPTFPQITIVEGVDSQGIKLADPLLDDMPSGSSVAVYPYGVSHGSVRNLHFEQYVGSNLGYGAIAGGGAYRMGFRRLTLRRGVSLFAVNGLAHCQLTNLVANVAKKGIELARYSHSTLAQNVEINPLDIRNDINLIYYATEAAHRMVFDNCNTDIRGKVPQSDPAQGKLYGIAALTGGTRLCVFKKSTLRANRHSKGFSLIGTSVKPTWANRIEDCEITADGATAVIRAATPGAGRHVIAYNLVQGQGADDSILVGAGTNDCQVINNVVPQGISNFGQRTRIENNSPTDTATTGPRQ